MTPRQLQRAGIACAISFALVCGFCGLALGQTFPNHGPSTTKFPPSALNPRFGELPARQSQPKEDVEAFVNPLSSTDGVFRVVVGQGRLLTLKQDILAEEGPQPVIAIGDPTVIDFEIVGPRHLRITGFRIGVTDISIVTADRRNFTFEVHVAADLDVLSARLRQLFPSASVKLTQIREHIAVEGEARDARQVSQIIQTVQAYVDSVQNSQIVKTKSKTDAEEDEPARPRPAGRPNGGGEGDEQEPNDAEAGPDRSKPDISGQVMESRVINLLRVPGPQQVMLKVQVAELNRTAFRNLGFSFLFQDGSSGIGSNIGNGIPAVGGGGDMGGFARLLNPLNASTTIFGVVENGKFNYFLDALRRNRVLRILAEPNLVAMNGQEASFLAGGEFPVPVPQSGAGGGNPTITIEYKKFGVQLDFKPVINDNDSIRLAVAPEVSSIDERLGLQLFGFNVPALNTRTARTVVELREGQTLAIAGLLQVELEGNTDKVPGLGDLKYIGPFFSNNSTEKVEKELVVLVTPYLVQSAHASELPALPGAEVDEPTDLELFLYGRIEGRTNCRYRSTTGTYEAVSPLQMIRLEQRYVRGPFGFSQ